MTNARVNHLGHAVADLERAERFWTEAFGFRRVLKLDPPDDSTAPLLGLEPPLDLRAVYLECDGLVLELLHYRGRSLTSSTRTMADQGFTHLSLTVDDLEDCLERVRRLGGEVIGSSRLGDVAIMVRDPDGQLVEILTRWVKPS